MYFRYHLLSKSACLKYFHTNCIYIFDCFPSTLEWLFPRYSDNYDVLQQNETHDAWIEINGAFSVVDMRINADKYAIFIWDNW